MVVGVLQGHDISGTQKSNKGASVSFSVHPWMKTMKIIVFFVDKRTKAFIIEAVA